MSVMWTLVMLVTVGDSLYCDPPTLLVLLQRASTLRIYDLIRNACANVQIMTHLFAMLTTLLFRHHGTSNAIGALRRAPKPNVNVFGVFIYSNAQQSARSSQMDACCDVSNSQCTASPSWVE